MKGQASTPRQIGKPVWKGIAIVAAVLAAVVIPVGHLELLRLEYLIPLVLLAVIILAGYLLIRLSDRTDEPSESGAPGLSPASETEARTEKPTSRPKPTDRKILILTGDTADRYGIKRYLDTWGTSTLTCPTAARGFAMLIEAGNGDRPFDAVILDQQRFEMDPEQFAISVRSEPELRQLYLIHVGPLYPDTLSDRLKKAGYVKLLSPPVDKTLLYSAVHDLSRTRSSGPQVVSLIDHYKEKKTRRPLSILLAEQNPADSRHFQTTLEQVGHKIFCVESGARLLDALDCQHFDIAIVSANLREVSGLEAFKLYRFTQSDHLLTPFVIMLDGAFPTNSRACKDAGVSAFLKKPIEPLKLLNAIDTVLEERNRGGAALNSSQPKTVIVNGLALDVHRLGDLELLGSGQDFLRELVEKFRQDNEKIIETMEKAALNCRSEEFKDLAHAIKDSAGSLGALALYHLGISAVRMSVDDFPQSALQLTLEIKSCNHSSYKALRQYLTDQENLLSR